jgi:N6-L-threonylcarbamoyladenine synthase
MLILAIESSCDETSVAVIKESKVLSNVISTQLFHKKYGGVVPELASRAHLESIISILDESLKEAVCTISEIDAIAVTSMPGLVGSLIVGSNFAKGLSIKYGKPIVPVNHIEGHLFSGCLEDSNLQFPFISLVVSGGHTALFYVESYIKYSMIGSTIDDAAGESFDKVASLLGLPYPGGPEIDILSQSGNADAYSFPRPMLQKEDDFNFSFSGLKTSVRYFLKNEFPNGVPENLKPDLSASFQEAVVDVLVRKALNAVNKFKTKNLIVAGGVSANTRLRKKMSDTAKSAGIKLVIPQLDYCMDNAAMIGFLAEKKINFHGLAVFDKLDFTVSPNALRADKKVKTYN